MAKEAAKPQSKYAGPLIPPSSSQKYSQLYFWVHRSWETDHQKGGFCHLSSFSCNQLKQLLSYFMHRAISLLS